MIWHVIYSRNKLKRANLFAKLQLTATQLIYTNPLHCCLKEKLHVPFRRFPCRYKRDGVHTNFPHSEIIEIQKCQF